MFILEVIAFTMERGIDRSESLNTRSCDELLDIPALEVSQRLKITYFVQDSTLNKMVYNSSG